MQERWQLLFNGQVQGVGFRYNALREVTRVNRGSVGDITGWVRNLDDGRVEMMIEGQDRDLQALLESINQTMNEFVAGHTKNRLPFTGDLGPFRILH